MLRVNLFELQVRDASRTKFEQINKGGNAGFPSFNGWEPLFLTLIHPLQAKFHSYVQSYFSKPCFQAELVFF